MVFYSFALKLTSCVSDVSLPVKMDGVNKLRIKSLSYVTATGSNRFLLIKINGWEENQLYFDGIINKSYTKFLLLPSSINTQQDYENTDIRTFDIIKSTKMSSINNFNIQCLINGDPSSDISPSNPIYMEIYVEGD